MPTGERPLMTLDDQHDSELLRRVAEGDEQAFVALYQRRHGPVYRFALRMSGSQMIAEEVTQDAFMALVRDAGAYDAARGTVGSYLFGITRNLVLRHLRERPTIPLEDLPLPLEAAAPSVLDGLARREDIERVRKAIASLPPRYREVVVLCELEALPYADAAAALHCPIGTVRSRLARARGLLTAKLRGEPVRQRGIRAAAAARCPS